RHVSTQERRGRPTGRTGSPCPRTTVAVAGRRQDRLVCGGRARGAPHTRGGGHAGGTPAAISAGSAQASAMDARCEERAGARRPSRLDAKHDVAAPAKPAARRGLGRLALKRCKIESSVIVFNVEGQEGEIVVPMEKLLMEHTALDALRRLDFPVATDTPVMRTSVPRYFATIQVLRGVAALLVVLFHLVDAERIYGRGPMLLDGIARLGFAGVDVFFVISGFVMVSVTQGLYGLPKNAALFLGRRVARIYPMYWLFTTVIVLMMLVMPHAVDPSFFAKSKLASYLLWPTGALPILQVGWTLTYEMFFYLVIAAGIAMLRERWVPLLLAGWAVAVLLAQSLTPTHPWQAVVTSPMAWEFIAGGLIAAYWRKLPAAAGRPVLWLGVAAFLLGAVVLSR